MRSAEVSVRERLVEGKVAFLGSQVRAAYRIPLYRYAYAQARLMLRTAGRKWLGRRTHDSQEITVDHNLKSLRGFTTRNEKLLLASMCVEDIEQSRTLIIGGRTEEEIFMFRGYGFRDVTAVDLISYSPLVVEADMHHLPFEDGSFDFIFCAYTLVYSKTPSAAAREFVRVLRDGGTVAIAVEYTPWESRAEIQEALLGYTITPDEKLGSVDDILALFGSHVGSVYVRYDAEKKRHHTAESKVKNPSPIMAVFSVAKDGFSDARE
jgi:SAM-dependent methyltransferase